MNVYIISYKRAGKVTTHNMFPSGTWRIVIPRSQEKDYLEHHKPEELLVIEDEQDGSASRKRNAVIDVMKTEEGFGLIVDDDLRKFTRIEDSAVLSPDESYAMFCNLFRIAFDIGAGLVGLNRSSDRMKYTGDLCPFSLTKVFYGAVGVIAQNIRYDEELAHGEDVDFFYQQVDENRVVVRDNRYVLSGDETSENFGWGKDSVIERTEENMAECGDALQKRWGKKLIGIDKKGLICSVKQALKGI